MVRIVADNQRHIANIERTPESSLCLILRASRGVCAEVDLHVNGIIRHARKQKLICVPAHLLLLNVL